MKSVKRPTEKSIDLAGLPFQPSASRTMILPLLIPAVNCWASIIRPLRGLTEPLFVQRLRNSSLSRCECYFFAMLLCISFAEGQIQAEHTRGAVVVFFSLKTICLWNQILVGNYK
jgi:hypothetical protein